MISIFRKKQKWAGKLDLTNLPRHIAIIMDGNGRWATRRGLPRSAGHAAGAENFRTIATHCKDIGVEFLTVYAFSTENWRRPEEEVSAIMGLLEKYLGEALEKMERDRIKMKFFGEIEALPERLYALARRTEEIGARYEGFQVNICINYGGRDEIIRATKSYAEDFAAGEALELSEEQFSSRLFSAGVPEPELLIRPGGEKRLSNFLLWQAAYAELYFSDVLWPDFGTEQLERAISWFQGRNRRFGGVTK